MYFAGGEKIIFKEWLRAQKISFSKANKQKGEIWSVNYVPKLFVFVLFLVFSYILLKYKVHGVMLNIFFIYKIYFPHQLKKILLPGRLPCAMPPNQSASTMIILISFVKRSILLIFEFYIN